MEILLKLLFFTGVWVAICYGIALTGGWNVLAEHYLDKSDFQGERFRFRSGQIGKASYGSCLTLGASPRGLYLATLVMFRFGHPPLFIPWEDISITSKKQWFVSLVQLEFSKAPGTTLDISKGIAHNIARASGGRFKNPYR